MMFFVNFFPRNFRGFKNFYLFISILDEIFFWGGELHTQPAQLHFPAYCNILVKGSTRTMLGPIAKIFIPH